MHRNGRENIAGIVIVFEVSKLRRFWRLFLV